MSATNFNSDQVITSLREFQLPVPELGDLRDAVEADPCLLRAIPAWRANNPKAINYLKGVMYALAPGTKERLQRKNLVCPPARVLVKLGRELGPDFGLRLKQWDESGDSDNTDDARFIRLKLSEALAKDASTNAAGGTLPLLDFGAPQQAAAPVQMHAPLQAPMSAPPKHPPSPPTQRPAANRPSASVRQPAAAPEPQARAAAEDGDPVYSNVEEDDSKRDREYISYHIYSNRYAACFSADTTRGGHHTVRLEAAEVTATNNGRKVNWSGKTAIQLSARELPLVLAVFLGFIPKFEGKGHGVNNEKWFTIEAQAGKIFLSVSSKGGQARGVQIPPGDAYNATTLLMRQMKKNDDFLSDDTIIRLVKRQADIQFFNPSANLQ